MELRARFLFDAAAAAPYVAATLMNALLILSALFAALTGAIGSARVPEVRQVEAVAAVAARAAQIVSPAHSAALPLPAQGYGPVRADVGISVPAIRLRPVAAIRGERRRE
ncbi:MULTISPECIES: hypothetical protein [unclassified Sphingomonas]|uniref:hypothetical protein n=1 Tax=unclassified Sphingomonas TaxID=196159 RepID=UPI0008333011|nr:MULTISPECIES: hypothetical protein [unclassified Sphingomonas]